MDLSKIPRYMRAVNAEQAEEFRAATAAGDYDLRPSERWWSETNQILEDHGYQLRSRLRPGWKPSWLDTDINPAFREDSLANYVSGTVDSYFSIPNMVRRRRRSSTQ